MPSAIPGPTASTPLLQAQAASSSAAARRSPSPSPSQSHRQSYHTPPSPLLLPRRRRRRSPTPRFPLVPTIVIFGTFALIAFAAWDVSSIGNCYFPGLCRALGKGKGIKEDVWQRNIGSYAPYRSQGEGGGKHNLPRGCEINQVNILHRHAARYPTSGAGDEMKASLAKIANRSVHLPKRHPELAFLDGADLGMTGWKYDTLMDQGRKAAWHSGREFAALYKHLVDTGNTTFYRSAGGGRVVETGQYWRHGFLGHAFKHIPQDEDPAMDVIIPESETSNNTLCVHSCMAYNNDTSIDRIYSTPLVKLLSHTVSRLNSALHPSPELNINDIIHLSDMCAFDSQARGTDWRGWSPWCGVFDAKEWELLGYIRDVLRFYDVGPGSVYGKTMGAGWINELIARLTDSPVQDSTSTNRTLDADEATFPQGGKRVFVDFSHDNEMIEIIAAMNVMPQRRPLSTQAVPRKRTYQLSAIIPFGARIVVERIGCDLGEWEPDPEADAGTDRDVEQGDGEGGGYYGDGKGDGDGDGDGRKNYVRILINDKLYPVDHVACQQSGFVEHGMCEVGSFLDSQSWAQNEVDWGLCNL